MQPRDQFLGTTDMRFIRHVAIALFAFSLAGCASTETKFNSGLWHYQAGLFGQAAPRLIDAVPELEQANAADPRVVTGYLALGRMAFDTGAPKDIAEKYYKKAIDLAGKYHTGDTTLSRNVATEVGNFYLEKDEHAKALPFLLQAAKISEKLQANRVDLHAIDLDNISLAHAGLGNYSIAETYSDKALAQLATLPASKTTQATRGLVFYNRASAFAEQGLAAKAEEFYRRSLDLIDTYGEAWRRHVVVREYAKLLRSQGREPDAQALERRYPQ